MIRDNQELEISEILSGESFQADTEDIGPVAVSEDQVSQTNSQANCKLTLVNSYARQIIA